MEFKGISGKNRALLASLHRETDGVFTVEEAAAVLGRSRIAVRRLLSSLVAGGWIVRLRRGLYSCVPFGIADPGQWRADPWLVAAKLLAPDYYIGGWTACEHWGLTDQSFRTTMAFTSRKFRRKDLELGGSRYVVRQTAAHRIYGISEVSLDGASIRVSDPTRTVLDVLDSPQLAGGIRPAIDILREYFSSPYRDGRLLNEYALRLENRTIFKRLGYLLGFMGIKDSNLESGCKSNISAGVSLLDPDLPSEGPIFTRWGLRVNSVAAIPATDR